jgi:hypothetical protein
LRADAATRCPDHLKPFKHREEIEKFTLPGIVRDCVNLKDIQYIYPNVPKTNVTKLIDDMKPTQSEKTYDNYVSWLINTKARGASDP